MNQHSMSKADLLMMAGGPLMLGAILGMRRGMPESPDGLATLGETARLALTLPLLIVGVAAATVPALYIAASLAGVAPPAREVGAALARGLRAQGVLFLGLIAPVAFLLATSTVPAVMTLLGGAVVAAGALAGLRVLFADVLAGHSDARRVQAVFTAIFAIWAVVALAIGAALYNRLVIAEHIV